MVKLLDILAFTTVWLSATSDSHAFVSGPVFSSSRPQTSTRTQRRLAMYFDGGAHHDLAILSAPTFLTSMASIPSRLPFGSALLNNPLFEAEIFNGISHGLDLSTYLRPATSMLRLSILIGRVCSILSDYVPDGYMNPEEVVFQTVMLLVALGAFLQSCLPLLLAASATKISLRDGRVYCKLFQGLGVSWSQYKAMKAIALDWIQLEPHQQLGNPHYDEDDSEEQECLYWLYSGDAQVHLSSSNKSVQHVSARSGRNGQFLGELILLSKLLDQGTSSELPHKMLSCSSSGIQAGRTGATLVRIDLKKLKLLMDQDDELSRSMRSLMVKDMHEKLTALMATS